MLSASQRNTAWLSRLATSRRRTVPSLPPETMWSPAGLKATLVTQPKCPGKCLGDAPALCERLMKGEGVSAEGDADPKWSALEKWGE